MAKENKINFDNLTAVMLVQLQTFNNEGVEITNDTVHNTVVSKTDGFKGVGSSADLYLGAVKWTIWANDGTKSAWPANWLSLSVKDLADNIISKQKY